ncbi:hypothetical protein ACJMK2_023112 [Sinanodonta woodiana]|uniref:Spaetzle domain-containing protein n=1 Tax=Sinanodonta woodiana TaxID=1069815 RepID=A0ABD3T362_SINWO
MVSLNGKTALFLAVIFVVQGNFAHETLNCKDELDLWCKREPFKLELPDIDPDAIIKLFPGLFHTETELIAIEKQEDSFREQRLSFETEDYKEILSLPGDGSMCCVTKQDLFSNATLKNTQGQLQYMVKLIVNGAEQLQYIPHGRCMEGGQCTGRCFQEYRTHPVLVYDLQSNQNPPVKFEYFNIPSYCSCKNVSPK